MESNSKLDQNFQEEEHCSTMKPLTITGIESESKTMSHLTQDNGGSSIQEQEQSDPMTRRTSSSQLSLVVQ